MDMALDTGADYAADLGQRLETILRRGHLYQNVAASDNANVHNGDRIYVTYNVTYNTSSSHDSSPKCTGQHHSNELCNLHGQLLRKRKRAADDIEEISRKDVGNNRRSLEIALSSLAYFSKIMERMENGETAAKIGIHLSTILEAMRQMDSAQALPQDIGSRVEDFSHQLGRTKCIKINTTFPHQQVTLMSQESRRVSGVTIGHWQFSLTTNVEEIRHPYSRQTCAILYAQPLRNFVGYPLAALFSENNDVDNVAWAHPTVTVYRKIIPINRRVAAHRTIFQLDRGRIVFDIDSLHGLIGLAWYTLHMPNHEAPMLLTSRGDDTEDY
jgi:hypothetical protein